jgi:protein-tyrosine kinase
MLTPKTSHLVERVAERLLRSGALDNSAAQLMRQPGTDDLTARDAGHMPAAPVQQSSLFAPPPEHPVISLADAGPQASPAAGMTVAATAGDHETASDAAVAVPPVLISRTLPSPATLLQTRARLSPPAQAEAAEHLGDLAPSPIGPPSIDALSLERAGMVDWSRTRTRISEEFRLVQRQILRTAFGPGSEPGFSNLLLVTSSRPGEGKSFMSTNLAGSIARQADHHVLLVDADSKRDSICYNLGLAQARGLLDLAANPGLDPAPLLVKTPIDRLSILPVGRERERSAELFSTKDMTQLIQNLGRRYADRLLILDAPPCLSTSDPAVLAQVVGQILFVVEADRTQRDEIEASLDLIQACPTITMVLNKQQVSSRYTFGAYSSYYSS